MRNHPTYNEYRKFSKKTAYKTDFLTLQKKAGRGFNRHEAKAKERSPKPQ